jgi:thiol-disulfide isomerase/thioredoxin
MRRLVYLLASAGGLAALFLAHHSSAADTKVDSAKKEAKPASSVGKTVKSFKLEDGEGKTYSFADYKDKKAVVIVVLGTECPLNNAYVPILVGLHKDYAEKGVQFVGINSQVHDTPARILAHVKANKIPFPVLKDTANALADELGAKRTPEAFVLSAAGKILYQGRIDDQIGIGFRKKAPTSRDLVAALDEVLAGKDVSKSYVEAPGCLIARAIKPKEKGTITFTKDVSRIMQNRCQECHRSGEVAPMPLVTYKDALAWSEMIKEVVTEKRMPPWSADPKHGEFLNDRALTSKERETLLGWIEEGCPKGDDKDLPAAKTFPKGWMIGKPDVVFSMAEEFKVPKDGGKNGISYKYFQIPTNYDEDRWIQAIEAKPGAREVVHHILVYAIPKEMLNKKGKRADAVPADGLGNGLLVAYAPGDLPNKLPAGHAKKLPKGSVLFLQMHYTPDGVERKDRSSVGIVFAKEAPKHEVRTRAITQQIFLIAPGAKAHKVTSTTKFTTEADLVSLLPHMHVRGKDFKYVAHYPDGKSETLLSVPKYDFNWQSNYHFKKPVRLPAGTRIECTAHFDNSADNPNNPDPKAWVHWGEQTWQEMMIGFTEYTVTPKAKDEKK